MNKEAIEVLNLLNDIKKTLNSNRNKKKFYDMAHKIQLNTYYTMGHSYHSHSYDSNIIDEISTYGSKLLYEYTELLANRNLINGYEL
jgi:hypothetical protein